MRLFGTILGKWFSVNQEKSQNILVWFLIGFTILFLLFIAFAITGYKADSRNPFNLPTIIGLLISIVAFYWSIAIALAQKEISSKLEKQNKEIEGVMAAVQKYCADLHAAMSYIYEDFIDSLNNMKDTKDVTISLYVSSLALGCISSPTDDDHHALEYYNKMISKVVEFGKARWAIDKAYTTKLHLYVWEKSKHHQTFSTEGGTRYVAALKGNRDRILKTVNILEDMFTTYRTKKSEKENRIDLFLHSTKPDTVRFFHVQGIVSDKLITVESSMILMMPSIAGLAQSGGETGSADLICMALWDGTEKGRERMGRFFKHYKQSCCGINDCDDAAKANAIDFSDNFQVRIKEYFGDHLLH